MSTAAFLNSLNSLDWFSRDSFRRINKKKSLRILHHPFSLAESSVHRAKVTHHRKFIEFTQWSERSANRRTRTERAIKHMNCDLECGQHPERSFRSTLYVYVCAGPSVCVSTVIDFLDRVISRNLIRSRRDALKIIKMRPSHRSIYNGGQLVMQFAYIE